MRASEVLKNPHRHLLLDFIRRDPGANFRCIARETGLARGTAHHHLSILKRAGLVLEHSHHSTTRFFERDALEPVRNHIILRREPSLNRLLAWLEANPRSPQNVVLQAMETQGWSRSTTQHRLRRLVNGGAATLFLRGRYKLYSSAPGHDPPNPRPRL